jgi:glycosyltransferase involved in cell wall biosynthesis
MRILFIAPQPFFESRGTPIAVRNMLRVLGRLGHKTDLVTYHAGQDVSIPGTTIHRCLRLPFKRIPIGFSFLKLLLDPLVYFVVIKRLMTRRYDVIHCVEEGIFLGILSSPRKDAVLCYDVDSSLSEQLTARGGFWPVFAPLLRCVEGWAVRKSDCAVTVCPALTHHVRRLSPQKPVFQIEDTPVVHQEMRSVVPLREKLSLQKQRAVVYIGNFEAYQGVDLLLHAFALVVRKLPACALILVGGTEKEVLAKKNVAHAIGIESRVRFVGFVPPEKAGAYLSLADVLVSPRCRGTNFPMKLYSYLASGKPVVATDLPVHRQLLNREIAVLSRPTPEGLAEGIVQLLSKPDSGKRLAGSAKRFVQREFSEEAYEKKVAGLYRWIAAEVARRKAARD